MWERRRCRLVEVDMEEAGRRARERSPATVSGYETMARQCAALEAGGLKHAGRRLGGAGEREG